MLSLRASGALRLIHASRRVLNGQLLNFPGSGPITAYGKFQGRLPCLSRIDRNSAPSAPLSTLISARPGNSI
jgi:hypothetical protein